MDLVLIGELEQWHSPVVAKAPRDDKKKLYTKTRFLPAKSDEGVGSHQLTDKGISTQIPSKRLRKSFKVT
jgi:hypothetical protein